MEKFFQGFVIDTKGKIMKGLKSTRCKTEEEVSIWAEGLIHKNRAIDQIVVMQAVGLIKR